MVTDTTICIHRDILEKLNEAVERSGLPRNQLISALMNHASKKMRKLHGDWIRTRYQQRRGSERCRRMHVRIRKDEYDFYYDLKKVVGFSISHIIAYMINNHLRELLRLMQNNPDNYRYRNYAINQLYIDGIECWIIYWGIPRRIIMTVPPGK